MACTCTECLQKEIVFLTNELREQRERTERENAFSLNWKLLHKQAIEQWAADNDESAERIAELEAENEKLLRAFLQTRSKAEGLEAALRAERAVGQINSTALESCESANNALHDEIEDADRIIANYREVLERTANQRDEARAQVARLERDPIPENIVDLGRWRASLP